MGARAILLPAWFLAGCLSASEGSADGDGGVDEPEVDAAVEACETVALQESFDDPGWSSDPRWAGSYEPDGSGMLREANGRAQITPTGVADDYAFFETESGTDFTDRCVHVEVPTMLTFGESIDSEALLGVLLDGEYWVTLGQSGGVLCCAIDNGETNEFEACEVDYVAAQHRWWRIRFRDGGVACEASPDKKAWDVVGDFGLEFPALTGEIDLYAGTWDTVEVPGEVEFDNLNL